jgi:MOSC domain-containing protein YiiM
MEQTVRDGVVEAVCASDAHTLAKRVMTSITLLEGLGVEGDAHAGVTVKHRSRVAKDPTQPNLRQVHLVHAEILDAIAADGFAIAPGVIGENVTTRGIALLDLPTGTRLHLGAQAIVEVTGLRNPCVQLDGIQDGLRGRFLDRDTDGGLVRLGGIMGVVRAGGAVAAGDPIRVELPHEPHRPLVPV